MEPDEVNPYVFRTNSIRGVFGRDLTEPLFRRIGGTFARFAPHGAVVACDHRVSSPSLKEALIRGLTEAGCDVSDAGLAPKGIAVFAGWQLDLPLAYVSASHLPAEWNGLKFIHPGGRTFAPAECAAVRDAFFSGEADAGGAGAVESREWREAYLKFLARRLSRAAAPLKLLADCGDGTAAVLAPALLERLGFEVTTLFGDVDGSMPNRSSELTPEALAKAGAAMDGHDLGLAFDGDADRVAFLDATGAPIDPERFAYVILRELVKKEDGPLVANVACGATIANLAERFGRRLYRTPVGTPHMIGEVLRRGAAFGMEISSHLVIPSVVPYDDAVAVGAYAAWALSRAKAEGRTLADLLAEVPPRARRRVPIEVADEKKALVMERLASRFKRDFDEVDELDGLRVEAEGGWALVRASNTEPALRLVVEAEDEGALEALIACFTETIGEAIAGAPA